MRTRSCLRVLSRTHACTHARVHTQGLWSIAFGWDMVNEPDLGRWWCCEGAAVVYEAWECPGLCHPEKEMFALHANSSCNLDS